MLDIQYSKFEFWVEFEVRQSLFKRFKSWNELYIRFLRLDKIGYSTLKNLNVEYRTSKKKYWLLSFYRFLKSDF